MKTVSAVIALTLLVSACGTRIQTGAYDYSNSTLGAGSFDVAKQWGTESKWETTPDGYPVW